MARLLGMAWKSSLKAAGFGIDLYGFPDMLAAVRISDPDLKDLLGDRDLGDLGACKCTKCTKCTKLLVEVRSHHGDPSIRRLSEEVERHKRPDSMVNIRDLPILLTCAIPSQYILIYPNIS